MALTRKQRYERKDVGALRYYAVQLGIHPADVEHYLGKKTSVYNLKKEELVELHLKLDKDNRGLGEHLG